MRKLIYILFLLPVFGQGQTLVDSYSESNRSTDFPLALNGYTFVGQSFTNVNSITLASGKAYMLKGIDATGSAYMKIYAHTGTYGTSSMATGTELATSDAFDVSTLSTSYSLATFTFSGANQITLNASTYYCVVITYPSASYFTRWGADNTSPAHGGNSMYGNSIAEISAFSGRDMCFYVYGSAAAPPSAAKNIFMGTNF